MLGYDLHVTTATGIHVPMLACDKVVVVPWGGQWFSPGT